MVFKHIERLCIVIIKHLDLRIIKDYIAEMFLMFCMCVADMQLSFYC